MSGNNVNFQNEKENQKDSKEFLELIERCKKQDPEALEKFFEIYSMEIYNFPMKVFQLTEEDAGDFFLFAFERLRDGKRFRSFRGDSTFRTWFYSVLRNLVLDWLRSQNKTKVIQFHHYSSFLEIEKQIKNNVRNMNVEDSLEIHLLKEKFYEIIEQFNDEMRIIFKLVYIFYLELEEKDIEILRNKFGKTRYEIWEFISNTKEYLANKSLKLKDQTERLNRMYLKLLRLQDKEKELKKYQENYSGLEEVEEELENLQNKIGKKMRNRNKMVEHLNPAVAVVRTPYQKIAEFLHISTPTVSSIFKKAEKQIKNSSELKKIFIS